MTPPSKMKNTRPSQRFDPNAAIWPQKWTPRGARRDAYPLSSDLTIAQPVPAYPTRPSNFGDRLRNRRSQPEISQAEAARRLGISAITLRLWERDRVFPTAPYH